MPELSRALKGRKGINQYIYSTAKVKDVLSFPGKELLSLYYTKENCICCQEQRGNDNGLGDIDLGYFDFPV